MKRYFLAMFLLASCGTAWASEDYVTVRYMPGLIRSGSYVEVSIKPFGKETIVADVYAKLKELQKSGSLAYLVPDAPSITIEVAYKGEVLKSAFTRNEPKLWSEAYAIVWKRIEDKLAPKL